MVTPGAQIDRLEQDGLAEVPRLAALRAVRGALDGMSGDLPINGRRRGGLRNALRLHRSLADLATDERACELAHSVLGGAPILTRAILFDKSPDANWDLFWHQDTTIAVKEHVETPAFGPWSVKGGIVHVQPPAEVLERMITVRLNLDECDEHNGPLLVLPGTHRSGLLSDDEVRRAAAARAGEIIACTGAAGDAVLMRPLLLHSSRKAESPRRRRILHLEFATGELPGGLVWADAYA